VGVLGVFRAFFLTRITRGVNRAASPKLLALGFTLILVMVTGMALLHPARSAADTNSTINFQARLMSAAGAISADGNYNVEFKLYTVGTSGTALWTEDYLNSNSQGIHVANGYLSANLGSITAFPSTINWDQNLYLGMTVRGTGSCSFGSCTPGDAEMSPRLKVTSTPYAFAAGKIAQYNATTGYTSTLSLQAPTGGNQIFQMPDQGAAGTYNLLTQETAASSYIKLQTGSPGTAQTGNLNITGTGIAGALQSSTFDTPSSGALSIGTSNASSISISKSGVTTSINGGVSISGGAVTLTGNAASSFKTADTTASAAITIQTGNSSSGTAGTIGIDTGTSSTGTSAINIGTTNAGAVSIGRSGKTTTVNGALTSTQLFSANAGITIGTSAGSGTVFTNNGATVNSTLALTDFSSGGSIGLATDTVDKYTAISIAQSSTGKTLSIPTPTANTTYGRLLYISNIGSASFTLLSTPLNAGATATLVWSNTTGGASWQYSGADGNSILNQTGSTQTGGFTISGTGTAGTFTAATFSSASNLSLQAASGNDVTISPGAAVAGSGTLNLGVNAATVNIGNSSDNTRTIAIGNTAGSATQTVTVGNNSGTTSTTTIQGSGGVTIQANGAAVGVIVKSVTNSSAAFQVQNASNAALFGVNTSTGAITLGSAAGSGTVLTNNGATLNSTFAVADLPSGGSIGTAPNTVDIYTAVSVNQTTNAGQTITVPTPTASTGYGRLLYITNIGNKNFILLGLTINPGATATLVWANTSGGASWTFAGADGSSIQNQTSSTQSAGFKISGTGFAAGLDAATAGALNIGSVGGITGTATSVNIGNVSSTTAIQSASNSKAFTVNNSTGASLISIDSTNSASGLNIISNGGAETGTPPTGYAGFGGGTSVTTGTGSDADGGLQSVKATWTTTSNLGTSMSFASSPAISTTYNVSIDVKQVSGTAFAGGTIAYSPDNGTTLAFCANYNTGVVSTTVWTKITCQLTTPVTTVTTPVLYFVQNNGAAVSRVMDLDNVSFVAQNSSGTQNTAVVHIGGVAGQGLTLFQLDNASSAPFTGTNAALAGSMYFDTTAGSIQCYNGTTWGACTATPNTSVTLAPEFANAVLHGSGSGTLTADFCSASLNINDGTSSQPTICGSGETHNYYKWTTTSASAQAYSVYVSYQLPSNFKSFVGSSTSLTGKTDTASNTVQYSVYKNISGTLTQCGSAVSVSSGVQTTWQTGTASGSADPASCSGFVAGSTIVFKIDVSSVNSGSAYVGNINFQYTNQ
jgi:hypothetical protein